MEKLPDPTQSAKELNRQFTHEIHKAIFEEFNKVGHALIEPKINELLEEYHRAVAIDLKLITKASSEPQSGKTAYWLDIPLSDIRLSSEVTPRDQEFIRKTNTLVVEGLNEAGHGPIMERTNHLIEEYGLDPGPLSVSLEIRVTPDRYRTDEHFEWQDLELDIEDLG